jgi:hypothetical protein
VGEIKVRNGLYRVDNQTEPTAMVVGTRKVVTLEELHRRMGHIAPEAARQLQCAKHKIGVSAWPSPLCSTAYQIFLGRKVGISSNISTNFLL